MSNVDLAHSLAALHRGIDAARMLARRDGREIGLQADALEKLLSSCDTEVLRLPPAQVALAALVDAAARLGTKEVQRKLTGTVWVFLTEMGVETADPLLTVLYAGV